jgi:hypothetical protein
MECREGWLVLSFKLTDPGGQWGAIRLKHFQQNGGEVMNKIAINLRKITFFRCKVFDNFSGNFFMNWRFIVISPLTKPLFSSALP